MQDKLFEALSILQGFFIVLVMLLLGTSLTYASNLLLQVEIKPGFAISLPDDISIPPIGPGETYEDTVTVSVKSNTPWDLQIVGSSNEQIPVFEVFGEQGFWRDGISVVNHGAVDQEPTGDSWVEVEVPWRVVVGYTDEPGTYDIYLEFTVVPVL